MKIIFLIDGPFLKRDYERFSFDILLKNNIELCMWDFQKLYPIKPKNDSFEAEFDLSNTNIKSRVFLSFNELENNTKLNGIFIYDYRVNLNMDYPMSWFKEKGAIIIIREQGLGPILLHKLSLVDHLIIIRNKFQHLGFIALIKAISKKTLRTPKRNYFDIKICSGSLSQCSKNQFEIRSHAFDYDIFLEKKNNKKNDRDYILFLVNGQTNHPDYSELNISPFATAEVYFPLLRSFFEKIEEQTGLPVIIALHPRLKINDSLSMQFGNREIFINKTAQLVRDAKLVVNHDSTAINFVALWRIPMVIITTNQIEKAIYRAMNAQDHFLQTTRVNINNPYDNMDFLKISEKPISQYNQYIENFIKVTGSPIENSAEIIIEGLNNYLKSQL